MLNTAAANRSSMTATLRPSFSGHETFVFRHAWLKKAVDAVISDPEVFTKDSAIVTLGVGKNMVRSIRHWALAAGVIAEEPKSRGARMIVTEFGETVFGTSGLDPYLEDPSTLWLLHWNILRQELRCTTWHWVFNRFPSVEFTREMLTQFVLDEARRVCGPSLAENSIRRDVDVFLRTYVGSGGHRAPKLAEDAFDCPLSELGLIEARPGSQLYQLQRRPRQTLGDFAFFYALCDFWDRNFGDQKTLAFTEIAHRRGSPGLIFRIDENSLADRLERLEELTAGRLAYAETAGIRQVYKYDVLEPRQLLEEHYSRQGEFKELEAQA